MVGIEKSVLASREVWPNMIISAPSRYALLTHVMWTTKRWLGPVSNSDKEVRSPAMVLASQSADYIGLANAPVLWILAAAVMGVVVVQSLIYMTAVKKNAESAGMTQQEVKSAFRAGGVAAIGPSLSVVLVAIALLPLFGTPPVVVRVGLIGSAATEVASASIAAGTMGSSLGDETFTRGVFIVALMAMSLSGAGWMISTLILTPVFKHSSHKLEKVNPALMSIIPGAALLAAFAALTFRELPKSPTHVIAILVSAVVMTICLFLAKTLKQPWLKEWGLGISLLVGLIASYFAHYAGLGAPEA